MNELLNWNETLYVLWVTGWFTIALNSPASSKCLLNVLGEPPKQHNEVHQRNANKHDKIT